jgi:nitrogen fixation NifU-like protein
VDLRELYQEVILDHNRHPRNEGKLDSATHHADGYNPLCGDCVSVFLVVEDERVRDVRFEGSGCAISTASASLMTEAVKGKTVAEAESVFREFQSMVTETGEGSDHDHLGDLAALAGVRAHPVRIKCATLAWHTMHAALSGAAQASTE